MSKVFAYTLALSATLLFSLFTVSAQMQNNYVGERVVYSPATRDLNFVDAVALNTYCILSKAFKSETSRDKCFTFAYNNESALDLSPIDSRLSQVESLVSELQMQSSNASNTGLDLPNRPEPAIKYVSVINNIINNNSKSNYNSSTNNTLDLSMSFVTNDNGLMPGHIVEFGTTTYRQNNYDIRGVVRAVSAKQAVGVADTYEGENLNNNMLPVAFAGRVSVRVTAENGKINMGDKITLSTSTMGIGVKLIGAGQAIGTALSSDNGSGFVLLLVKNEFIFDNNNISSILNNNLCSGEICLDQSTLSKIVNFVNNILPKLENMIK